MAIRIAHMGTSSGFIGTLVLCIAALGMLALLLVRVPTWLADALILINFGFSVVLLVASLQVRKPTEYAVLPSILLISTFYRLALSLATTRLVLLDGDAGHVIETFGEFLLGGNVVVGLVVFLILTVVQFIVITKGAERVAEVSARFSLDAMPGQQMAIEADLRAGLIDGVAAAQRRSALTQESRFFGALDGAMKFIKGDAIAGIVIVFVNLLGGIAIGCLVHGLTLAESTSRFMVLSIGDGMVAQIPSMVGALSCSFIITRVSTSPNDTIASDIWYQVIDKPGGLILGALFLLGMALVPGMPIGASLIMATMVIIFCTYRFWARRQKEQSQINGSSATERSLTRAHALVFKMGHRFERAMINADLDPAKQLHKCCEAAASKYGVQIPPLTLAVQEDPPWMLQAEYEGAILARFDGGDGDLIFCERDKAKDFSILPGFTRPVCFGLVASENTMNIENYKTVPHERVPLCFLERTLALRLSSFLNLEVVKSIENDAKVSYPEYVSELQRVMPSTKMCDILRIVVADGISIAQIRPVFDAVLKIASKERDSDLIGEFLRMALATQIMRDHATDSLAVAVLDPNLEDFIRERVRHNILGAYIELEGEDARSFEQVISNVQRNCVSAGLPLLVHADLRSVLKLLLTSRSILIPVLSIQEIPVYAEIKLEYILRIDE